MGKRAIPGIYESGNTRNALTGTVTQATWQIPQPVHFLGVNDRQAFHFFRIPAKINCIVGAIIQAEGAFFILV